MSLWAKSALLSHLMGLSVPCPMNFGGKFAPRSHGAFILCSALLRSNADLMPPNYRAMQTLTCKITETLFQGQKQQQKYLNPPPPKKILHLFFKNTHITEIDTTLVTTFWDFFFARRYL